MGTGWLRGPGWRQGCNMFCKQTVNTSNKIYLGWTCITLVTNQTLFNIIIPLRFLWISCAQSDIFIVGLTHWILSSPAPAGIQWQHHTVVTTPWLIAATSGWMTASRTHWRCWSATRTSQWPSTTTGQPGPSWTRAPTPTCRSRMTSSSGASHPASIPGPSKSGTSEMAPASEVIG